MLKAERGQFAFIILTTLIGYVGVTFWLNAIRASWPIWIVWVLIIIQLLLYILIFSTSWGRSKVLGLNTYLGFIIFTILAVLGRIENWEIIIIPLTIIVMLVFSAVNKKVSKDGLFKNVV